MEGALVASGPENSSYQGRTIEVVRDLGMWEDEWEDDPAGLEPGGSPYQGRGVEAARDLGTWKDESGDAPIV